jgi:pantoate--beta-alanine ligase
MEKISDPNVLQSLLTKKRHEGKSIGFIPTMGALHSGHLSLVQKSQQENDITVVSIFVNPTQFNQSTDFEKYPRDLDADANLLANYKVDFLFTPTKDSIYPDNYNYSVQEKELTQLLCGKARPGHFAGVLTVIIKLIHIVVPSRMYMGEKDYQQLTLIQKMVKAFFLPVEVIGVPTQRDEAGLALSSRNQRLSEQGVAKARKFAKILTIAPSVTAAKEDLKKEHIDVDYVEEFDHRRFGAVFIEGVRLIDNVQR